MRTTTLATSTVKRNPVPAKDLDETSDDVEYYDQPGEDEDDDTPEVSPVPHQPSEIDK